MEKQFFSTLKNYINAYKDEFKVYKKIGNNRKLNRIISIISEYGKNTQLYTFMMSCLSKINLENIEYSYNGINITDDSKSLKINLYPNYKEIESIRIDFIDNNVISQKEFTFSNDEVNVREYKKKNEIEIKTDRKYIDNKLIYEDVTRIKKSDKDNYYLVSNTSHVDENNTVIMKEFVQKVDDGFIDSQYFKYYRGYLLDEAKYYTRSGYNIEYLYKYLEEDNYELSYNQYNNYLNSINSSESKVIKLQNKKN